jgi:type I restriction enzyme M protein
VFNRSKPRAWRGKILFIHAAKEFEAGKNQNFLRDTHVAKIVDAYRRFEDIEKFASVVGLEAIRANDHNLNISRYVDIAEEEEKLDVAEELHKLREMEKARAAAEARMNELLAELGFKV